MIGALLAGAVFLQQYQAGGGNLSDWKLWVVPALLAVLGYLAKDAGVTGGLKVLGLLLCCLLVVSCSLSEREKATLEANLVKDGVAGLQGGLATGTWQGAALAAGGQVVANHAPQAGAKQPVAKAVTP